MVFISKLHELIVKALGRDVDERDTSKRMTELMKNNMVLSLKNIFLTL